MNDVQKQLSSQSSPILSVNRVIIGEVNGVSH